MADWLTGLVGGIVGRKSEIEQQNITEERLAQQRETNLYNTLLASPDPEIRNMAVSGLIEGTRPKARATGLRGWVGERQASPVFQRLQDLMKTPVTTTETVPGTPTLGSAQFSAGAVAPDVRPQQIVPEAPGTAGPSPNQSVKPGAAPITTPETTPAPGAAGAAVGGPVGPPPTPISITGSPPTPVSIMRQVQRPRQAFLSPQETMLFQQTAPAEALYTFMKAHGATEEEAVKAAVFRAKGMPMSSSMIAHPGGDALGSQILAANPDARDEQGQPIAPGTTYRRQVNLFDQTEHYYPTLTPSSQQGHFQTLMVDEKGQVTSSPTGRAGIFRVLPDNSRQFIGYKPTGVVGLEQALTAASQLAPNASLSERLDLADQILAASGSASGAPAGVPGAPSAAPAPAAGAPTAGVGGPPPAPSAAPSAAAGAPGAPAAAPPGPPPAPTTPGAKIAAGVPGLAGTTRVPMSEEAKTTLGQIDSVEQQVQTALNMLDKEGFTGDDPSATARYFTPYLSGQKGNNGAAAIAQLLNFIRVTGAQPYMRGTRAVKWVDEIQAHLPRIPQGPWESRIGGSITYGGGKYSSPIASELTRSEGYDSPDLIREKLQNLPTYLNKIRQEIIAVEGSQPSHQAAPGQPGQPPPSPSVPYKGSDGKWYLPS